MLIASFSQLGRKIPSGAKALTYFSAFTAWLKPCPYYKASLFQQSELLFAEAMPLLQSFIVSAIGIALR
jgi:hypothetical protein